MTQKDKSKLSAWTMRLISLRAAAKGTTKYQEALNLKAELMERAEKRELGNGTQRSSQVTN